MADVLQPARGIGMLFALLAVVMVAPFERVLFSLPGGVTMTTVELVTLGALSLYAVTVVRTRAIAVVPVSPALATAAALFLGSLGLAAVATRFEQANALRFVARMVIAAALGLATVYVVHSSARARLLARAMVTVATLVAAVAVLEALQVRSVTSGLTVFRPGFHVVAGQLRATSTLFYPTIASMYLEVAFVMGLWLLLDPSPRRRDLERALVFVALITVGAGISATFTRAGLLAMAAALGIVALLRLSRVSRDRADLGVLTALATAIMIVTFIAHSPELLAARMTTEGSNAWYGADYEAPRTFAMRTGETHRVPVTITNTGRLTWDSFKEPAFALSYHWLRGDAVVEFEGERTPFPSPLRPGESVTFDADVVAPGESGTYTLAWDVVHETRAWLSTEGVDPARTEVTVNGIAAWRVATKMARLPPPSMRPARPQLWAAAFALAKQHPLLGIGPDNYRLAYGAYIGMPRADPRVHANNMYLEVLTGAGLLGVSALLLFIGVAAVTLWHRLRTASDDTHTATAVAMALWVVIVAHGLVDSFLSFTTMYVTFAVAAGWAISPGIVKGACDAHRV